ncbi:MAG TPA: outer membrane beta-barrel protein [Caulobacteraceae bacterium]|jgi:opacity protein-like surface antigen
MKSVILAATAALAASAATTTHAQDQTAAKDNYFQVNLGTGLGGNAHLSASATGIGSAATDINIQPGFFGSGAVGHSFLIGAPIGVALEGEGFFLRNSGDTNSLGFGSHVESYGGLANLMYAIGRIQWVVPYVGGGIGYGHVEYSAFDGNVSDSGFVWQLRAGFSGDLTRTTKWDVGYRYLAIPTYGINGSILTSGGSITGNAKIETHLHVLTFGIRQHF